jgi:ATP-dependent protease ClpP protease subunit
MSECGDRDGIRRDDGNHVYFYSEVNDGSCLALLRELRAADIELRSERAKGRGWMDIPMAATPIILHIFSYGGDLLPAFGVADQIERMLSPVHSVIEGVAASAATLISMAAHRRYITPNSFMLIHQLSSLHWGTYDEAQDERRMLDMLMAKMTAFYAAHSAATKKQVRRILHRDSWFDAEDALLLGFVDEVV